MRFGSLFTGIGGLDLGLERAGMQCEWQVEIDPYARRVLEKHWPAVPKFGDIRECHGNGYAEAGWNALGHVDLIAGGFPCQDISVAGKGAGLGGARSGLWFEYRRIIEEVAPSWVLIENVPALRTRGLDIVLSDLHALGFDAEWDGLSAASVGAPHLRDRIFIVAYAQCLARNSRGSSELSEGAGGRDADRSAERAGGLPDSVRVGLEAAEAGEGGGLPNIFGLLPIAETRRKNLESRASESIRWGIEPDMGRVANGIPARVDRLRGLGNAVVPQVAEHVGRLIMEANRVR